MRKIAMNKLRRKPDLLPSRAELEALCEEAMLRLAFYDADMKESEEMIHAFTTLPAKERDKLAEQARDGRERVLKAALSSLRRSKIGEAAKNVLLPIGKAVAMVAIVLSIGISTVVAGSGELRKAMFELIFIPRKTHTEIQFIEHEEKAFEVPDGWLGRYFPSFLPKGYETVQVTSAAEGSSLVSFMNNDGDLMHFSENTSDTYTSIDTEDADVSNVLIRGYKGLMSVKEGRVILVWSADERYFVLNIDGDEKLAIEIAESLRLVR